MPDQKKTEEDRELPHRMREGNLATAGSYAGRPEHELSLTHGSVERQVVRTVAPGPSDFSDPGIQTPGLFINTRIQGLSVTIKERSQNIAEFHDSESEDIYDLYNACNGAVGEDGFLDVGRLNELSNEEREIFSIERLREIWQHTISGCAICAGIVRTLNSVRQIVGDEASEYHDEFIDPVRRQ